jgi:Tol biopolymer transport system component
MNNVRSASAIIVTSALIVLTGCSSPVATTPDPTSSATPTSNGLSAEIGDRKLLVDWQQLEQVSSASPWELTSIVNADGPSGSQLHGEWSPDGKTIVFAVDDSDGTRDLWTADVETGTAKQLLDCAAPCVWTDEPTYSVDGSSIAYIQGDSANDGTGIGTLRTMPIDGGEPVVRYTSESGVYPMLVSESPDSDRWAIELLRFATTDVADEVVTGRAVGIVNESGELSMLTDMDAGYGAPDWSPDGASLLITDDQEIWSIPESGGEPTALTDLASEGGRALLPAYSADGRLIAFNVEQPAGSTPTVAVMSSKGGEFEPLGPGTHPQLQP